jgi:hypothetical protein
MSYVMGKSTTAKDYPMNVDQVITKRQLADFLAVSTRTIENLVRDHRLWHRKTNGMVRFHFGDVLTQFQKEFLIRPLD